MEKSDAQNLYEIINDFIEQTHLPIMELSEEGVDLEMARFKEIIN